jgi:hypothetical protein
MSIAIIYRADSKAIKEAWHAYLTDEYSYWEMRTPFKAWLNKHPVPIKGTGWLTFKEMQDLELRYSRWLTSYDSTDYFKPFCTWCHYARDPLADDNEHEECDACLDELADLARVEDDAGYEKFMKTLPVTTLGACQPALPSVVLDKIASFL